MKFNTVTGDTIQKVELSITNHNEKMWNLSYASVPVLIALILEFDDVQ